jgi:hypothetical protein
VRRRSCFHEVLTHEKFSCGNAILGSALLRCSPLLYGLGLESAVDLLWVPR